MGHMKNKIDLLIGIAFVLLAILLTYIIIENNRILGDIGEKARKIIVIKDNVKEQIRQSP